MIRFPSVWGAMPALENRTGFPPNSAAQVPQAMRKRNISRVDKFSSSISTSCFNLSSPPFVLWMVLFYIKIKGKKIIPRILSRQKPKKYSQDTFRMHNLKQSGLCILLMCIIQFLLLRRSALPTDHSSGTARYRASAHPGKQPPASDRCCGCAFSPCEC